MHVRATTRFLLAAAFSMILVPAAAGQQLQVLALEGQEFFDVGTVVSIEGFRVNDEGDWVVHLTTDALPAYTGHVLLRNGLVTLQGGDALLTPPGAEIGAFDDFTFNTGGDLGTILTLLEWDTDSDEGVFFNTTLVAQESGATTAPEFSSGTTWISFDEALLNDVGQIIIQGMVDDADIVGTTDQVIVVADIDPDGQPLGEQAILWETGPLPGSSLPIERFATVPRSFDANRNGGFIVFVDTTGSGTTDGNVYTYLDGDLVRVAQEGRPSPVAGRNWVTLLNRSVAVNDFGDHALSGTLTGDTDTDLLLVKNGEKFVQEGDVLPSLAPYRIRSFQNTSIHISNAGDVFWFGQFDITDPSRNQGIFRNFDMLVQKGVTRAAGRFMKTLRTSDPSFAVSPNGRYVIFEAGLDDGREGAFLLDLGLVDRMSECYGNEASLRLEEGLPMTGTTLQFELHDGQGPGVTPILMVSTLPAPPWPSCGVPLPFGELLIDVSPAGGNPALALLGNPWFGVPVRIDLVIPADPILVGATVYAQGLFWDIGDQLPAENLRLTGGMKIVIVAP